MSYRRVHGRESCGAIWEQYGIQRTEIALRTVERINLDPRILPTLRLGITIRDSCWTERIAMEQTIEFIRDALGQSSTSDACCADEDTECVSSFQARQASRGPGKSENLAAVVGPGNSAVTIAVHNLLQVFRIPQIGYSATSTTLSDKTEFSHFMRTVPSDAWQAQAMLDIVKHFKWRYVAVVYSDGNYGEKGFEELRRLFDKEDSHCIASAHKIRSIDPIL